MLHLPRGTLRVLATLLLLLPPSCFSDAQTSSDPSTGSSSVQSPEPRAFPYPEALDYNVEWRLIDAGSARLRLTGGGSPEHQPRWEARVKLQSAGLVSKLYRLNDDYDVRLEDQFCATAINFDAQEGKRHHLTRVTFDRTRKKADYLQRDLIKNTTLHADEIDTPACVTDVIGALYRLRTLNLQPGQSAQLPVSDGKKSVSVRIEAQEHDEIKTKLGTFKTTRYEAYLFNGVLYSRHARVLIWLTDDARRLPVQISCRVGIAIGTITLQLEKEGPA